MEHLKKMELRMDAGAGVGFKPRALEAAGRPEYGEAEGSVSAIKESFFSSRDTHVRLLKKRYLEDASRDEQSQEEATKPKARARRAPKSRAAPKRATRVAPPRTASVPC